ncbi:hypothetical protein ALQ37_05554, partial [Pseudomonas syringae pv. aptata]
LVALRGDRQLKAVRHQRQRGIEYRRQADAAVGIAHRPAVVVVQVIGITEHHVRLPFEPEQRFTHRSLGADVIGMGVDGRVRHHHNLRPGLENQRAQVGEQVVPGRLAVVAGQWQGIELTEQAGIGQIRLTRTNRRIRRGLHGRQLQAEIAQLNTLRLGHPAPARHRDTVPSPQAAFHARSLGALHAHLLIMLGLDLTGGQCDDPRFLGLAVKPESGQLGIVGVRCDDHDTLFSRIRLTKQPEPRRAGQTAATPAQFQHTCGQRLAQPGEVQIAHAADATLECLLVVQALALQLDHRVEKTPEPGTFDRQRQYQRLVAVQLHSGVDQQRAAVQAYTRHFAFGSKGVLIVVRRRIEQMIGEPGLMSDPGTHGQQRGQPPSHQHAHRDQQEQPTQQRQPLVTAMAFEQLLLATQIWNTGTGLHHRSLYSRSARPKEKRSDLPCARAFSQADWVLTKLSTLPGLKSRVWGSTPPLTYSMLTHCGASTRYTS